MLATLATEYVMAMNTGSVPTIASAWESVVKIEGSRALENATKYYNVSYGPTRLIT